MSENHRLDTDTQVLFYENDFYVLSNFSAFKVAYKGHMFDTSEAAYHWEKFAISNPPIAKQILESRSAHESFKIAEQARPLRRADWDDIKIGIMKTILWHKVSQHYYVREKLLATGNRELIEDSWRDDFWGWGPDRNGRNILGKIWMEIRAELQKP